MKRKLRSVAALLLVVTCVIYVIALVQSIRAYEVWKQVRLEETQLQETFKRKRAKSTSLVVQDM